METVYTLTSIDYISCALKNHASKIGIFNMDIVPIEFKDGVEVDPQLLDKVKILIADSELLAKFYKRMPLLKWAHCTWAGVEALFKFIDKEPPFKITRHGGEVFSNLMVEYVFTQVLNCERQFHSIWRNQISKNWEPMNNYRPLRELTITVLGIGNMGTAIAKFFKEHGCRVYGFCRTMKHKNNFTFFTLVAPILKEVVEHADFVINTLPSTKETHHLLNDKFHLCKMKPVFINVGRADIVSECELLAAIRMGLLKGAVLDVFESEPLSPVSELWEMPQVIITPHCAAVSRCEDVAEQFVVELHHYLSNEPFQNEVDWDAGY